ncbi:Gfo/Idh/MocA family oxidoreductase [Arthrobacter sp. 9V]|uniref:Gfo/Idh/MocA family protein n=1 Tax=Arthrobacter sp. 9V TaxID=2653132 RepID=UPI0012F45B1C|nr:Gfo/Idh/MocA family oxidoreductase [Arthrobacter sp. 9V]VXC42909.1 Gfo/Idh/MocA family oxidoreductase [Arthrobacter sp. 9V]
MRTAQLNIGIIGGGVMGTKHASIINAEGTGRVVAVADPVSDRLATSLGVPNHVDYQHLLSMPGLDAVVVASPNDQHVTTALACLNRSIPVLLEKPVASSIEEGQKLAAALEGISTPILVGHHRRHNAAVTAAQSFIHDGGLGRIVAVNSLFLSRKPEDYFNQAWHRLKGAGVLLINLVHDIDLLRYLCGDITRVAAITSSGSRGYEVEDTAAVTAEFASGALGTFIVSDSAASPVNWDQVSADDTSFPRHPGVDTHLITGTKGSLTLPQLTHYYYPDDAKGHWKIPMAAQSLPAAETETYANQWKHFLDVIDGTAEPIVSVTDALRTIEIVEAIRAAAIDGKTTAI